MIQNKNGFILFDHYFGSIIENETGENIKINNPGLFIRLIPYEISLGKEKYNQFLLELEEFIKRWGCEPLPIYEKCGAHIQDDTCQDMIHQKA